MSLVGTERDISDHTQAVRALRESEERFRALIMATSDVVYRMSPDWTEMRELRGREFIADTNLPSGGWLEKYIPADEQARVMAAISEAIRTRTTFELEHRVLRVDGTEGWTFSRAIPHLDENGAIVEWFGAASDITARKRAEEALRESEERFRLLVQGTHDYAIYMLAPDGTVSSWSAAAERMFGYREEEIIGRHRAVFFTDDQRATSRPQKDLEEAAVIGRHETEAWRVRKDGSRFWANVILTVLHDDAGEVRGYANVTRDFTERMRSEAALRDSEERLRLAQEVARVGTFRWNIDSGVNTWTPELEALYGLPAGGFPGTEDAWEALIHPEDRAEAVRRVERAFETGAPTEGEWRVVWPDGSVHWIAGRWQVLKDSSGKPLRMTGINMDVTERKRSEELRASEAALREADREKDQFLAMLSHELRNPLAPIRNSLYLLDHAAPGGEQATRAKAILHRQVGQLTWLIDELLDVTRITHGKVQLQRERLDLNEFAHRAADDQRTVFVKSEVRLEVLPAPAEVWVNGDRVRLTQVIGNLLQNAAKFTPRGGKATISVESDAARGQAVLTVRDTGGGIQPEMLPRLFQAFTQADTTLDRSKGGLGLGLALVKGLVELHGGSVSASSEGLGRGAAFTIRLPLDVVAMHAQEQSGAVSGPAPRRVLVIEDNEDAVLCDIGLPEMDGYAVARAMRADPELRGVGLVAVSGYTQPEDVAMSKEAGFDVHLAKPPSVDKLKLAIEEAGAVRQGRHDLDPAGRSRERIVPVSRGGRKNLMVLVTDDAEIREALSDLVENLGHSITSAAHGRDALDHIAAGIWPCAILLDWRMPTMDGSEFLDERERSPALRDIPVFVISGTHVPTRDSRVAGWLTKPFDAQALVAVLGRVCSAYCRRPECPFDAVREPRRRV